MYSKHLNPIPPSNVALYVGKCTHSYMSGARLLAGIVWQATGCALKVLHSKNAVVVNHCVFFRRRRCCLHPYSLYSLAPYMLMVTAFPHVQRRNVARGGFFFWHRRCNATRICSHLTVFTKVLYTKSSEER